MTDIEDIGTALPLVIKSVFELDERLKALETDNMQSRCGAAAKANGWHEDYENIPEEYKRDHIITKAMLIVSELAEAVEELRDGFAPDETYYSDGGKPEGFAVELADAVIRSYDLAEMLGLDLDARISEKLEFNKTRGYKHGKTV